MMSLIEAPSSKLSNTTATGIRVFRNTAAPLRLPRTLSTPGHCDQSSFAIFVPFLSSYLVPPDVDRSIAVRKARGPLVGRDGILRPDGIRPVTVFIPFCGAKRDWWKHGKADCQSDCQSGARCHLAPQRGKTASRQLSATSPEWRSRKIQPNR
jgi:hypothetical protein